MKKYNNLDKFFPINRNRRKPRRVSVKNPKRSSLYIKNNRRTTRGRMFIHPQKNWVPVENKLFKKPVYELKNFSIQRNRLYNNG